jgi:preprotein translocase subunit SecA
LIISGPAEGDSGLYAAVDKVIPSLIEGDFEKDEKVRAVTLTETGTEHAEQLLKDVGLLTSGGLYDIANVSLVHHINQALRAHKLFERDTDYIVKDGQIVLIDEFTGRMMEGRRYSEGLHQALEAKEGVEVASENQTLASITYQNYFRMYPKLAGMTGTAMTEAGEFAEIYKLEVVEIPTNLPCVRDDMDDEVYRTGEEKTEAIVATIEECHARNQPMLVGTVSIEKSELLSERLKKRNIPHEVLNARYHEREAYIIAQAGKPGAITIATNMAGRGTDIQLGGNVEMQLVQELEGVTDEAERAAITQKVRNEIAAAKAIVKEAGGLYVLGTERHESRRIDNQLRGRSGRQGDPGASKFFLSLEDDLMRIFGSERMDGMLQKLGLEQGEAIVHPWINKALEKAQQKVEARNFEIRKNLLKFDNVMNDQRKVIYEQRKELMAATDVHEDIEGMRDDVIEALVSRCMPEKAYAEQWDTDALHEEALRVFGLDLPVAEWAKEEGVADTEIAGRITEAARRKMAEKAATWGPEIMRHIEKSMLVQILDQVWKEHLLALDHLRQGIGLRAFGQKDPLNEYKREAFEMFDRMLEELHERVTFIMSHLELQVAPDQDLEIARGNRGETVEGFEDPAFAGSRPDRELETVGAGGGFGATAGGAQAAPASSRRAAEAVDPNDPGTWGKIGRNQLCPCGSGKKFKHCHGRQ